MPDLAGSGRTVIEALVESAPMETKCEKCGSEATVHDTRIESGGEMRQVHLCERCAVKMGFITKDPGSLSELAGIGFFPVSGVDEIGPNDPDEAPAEKPKKRRATPACEQCGMTWSEFSERGKLQCPGCYDAFQEQLGLILERTHEGGTHHVGKTPKGIDQDQGLGIRLSHARKQLSEALAAEQYEKAAELRDQIAQMCRAMQPADSESPAHDSAPSTDEAGTAEEEPA
ncbi:MAG: hypothetical protein D8M59_06995 [Planctomycetes bacterium]|nr:hypothetical protein [Planctomycetota bacterium]